MMWREQADQWRERKWFGASELVNGVSKNVTARASLSTARAKMLRRERVGQRRERKCYGTSELVNGASIKFMARASCLMA